MGKKENETESSKISINSKLMGESDQMFKVQSRYGKSRIFEETAKEMVRN